MENKIKAVIAEDVESYLLTIELLIGEVAPEVMIAGKATTLADTERLIGEVHPDLLLLDIQFEEEGATVFDLLDRLLTEGPLPFRIIFITAHLEPGYFSKAFDFGALHFLEKPIDKAKLREAIDRIAPSRPSYQYAENPGSATSTQSAENLSFHPLPADWIKQLRELQLHMNSAPLPGRLVVDGAQFNEVVEISDIVFMEASGRYTEIRLVGGKTFCASQNLGEFEKKLLGYPQFVRIHHNKIINLNYVKRFSRKERLIELIPPCGSHIASRERFRDFLQAIES